jgi:hypothetical protein
MTEKIWPVMADVKFSLNNLTAWPIKRPVNRWKAMIALLLAMLYLPATGHCALEQAGWFPPAGDCCEQTASATGSQDSSCAEGCCPVESGGYFSPNKERASVLTYAMSAYVMVLALDILPRQSPPVSPESSPPELLKVWQFTYRTALLPRAPSFVS